MDKIYSLHCDCAGALADEMYDLATEGNYVVAALHYDRAIEVMRELLGYEDVEVSAFDIAPIEYDGYDKEFYVSLADDMVLTVKPACRGNKYVNACADLLFVDADASTDLICELPREKYAFVLWNDDTEDCEDEDTDEKGLNEVEFELDLSDNSSLLDLLDYLYDILE